MDNTRLGREQQRRGKYSPHRAAKAASLEERKPLQSSRVSGGDGSRSRLKCLPRKTMFPALPQLPSWKRSLQTIPGIECNGLEKIYQQPW